MAENEPRSLKKDAKAKSCAECRRLKIRCDRQVPCLNCQKRGTASICPDGQLQPKGHRLILSNTEELHARIEELTERVKELEEALAALQALHSEETHPLLVPSKEPPTSALGSLRIHDDGNTRFYGPTSSIEWVMTEDEPHSDRTNLPSSSLAYSSDTYSLRGLSDVPSIDASFPLNIGEDVVDPEGLKYRILNGGPSKSEAMIYVESYFGRTPLRLSSMSRPIFINEYFGPCYDPLKRAAVGMQHWSAFYAVLSLGAFFCYDIEDHSKISQHYISLSRACLSLESPIINTSLTAIHAMLLNIAYFFTDEEPIAYGKGEVCLAMTMRLAQTIGMHRDPSIWQLPPEVANERRLLMWDLVSCDLWGSLLSGRPPVIERKHFDVKLTTDVVDKSEPDPNYDIGKYLFCETCLWPVLDLCLAATSKTTYAAVLNMDTKIRQFKVPSQLSLPRRGPYQEEIVVARAKETMVLIFREVTLLCLHRSYFARALLEPPFDPLNSRYARSVFASYASACAILTTIRTLYERQSALMLKAAFFWTNAFTAAAILGAIASRAPDSILASTAIVNLDRAVELFKQARKGKRVARGLPALLRLQEKAHKAINSFMSGTWTRPTTTDSELHKSFSSSGIIIVPKSSSESTLGTIPGTNSANNSSSESSLSPGIDPKSMHPPNHPEMVVQSTLGPPTSDSFLQSIFGKNWSLANLDLPSVDGATESSRNTLLRHPGSFISSGSQTMSSAMNGTQQELQNQDLTSTGPTTIRTRDEIQGTAQDPVANNQHPTLAFDDPQASVLWEAFLREMGVPNYGE
ncbi:hypothetical protein CPB86DRAFT_768710 [Serendipita vermifera]|nr:hypothetical protein CPB86DRAFT_768710 [Serendipita vermifera]